MKIAALIAAFAAGANADSKDWKYGGATKLYHGGKSHSGKPKSIVDCEVPECPEGFIRKGGYCVQGEVVPKEESCPEGAVFDDGECILTIDGRAVCERGTSIGDLYCELKDVKNSHLVCPDGSLNQGDQCLLGGLVDYCPAGTARTLDGRCQTIVAKDFFCPPYLKDAGGICVDYEYAEVLPVCPEDTLFENGLCTAQIEREPLCPKGFADEGDTCALFEAPIRDVCPEGYRYDTTELTCIASEIVDATPTCPDGGHLVDGKCQKISPGPLGPVCEEGTFIEGLCHVQSTSEPENICPEGYGIETTPYGPICTKSVPYDCSVPCGDAPKHYHAKKAHGAHGRKLEEVEGQGKKGGHSHMGKKNVGYCVGIEPVEPKTCYETVTAEAIPVCPPGTTYNGQGLCITKDVFPPADECLASLTADGECVIVSFYMPVNYCPDGFVPYGSDQCEQIEIASPGIRCPPNTEEFEGKCAIFVAKECPGAGCYETLTWPAESECPVDFTLVLFDASKGHKMVTHEERCVREIYSEQWSTCPTGYEPLTEETCASYSPPIIRNDEVAVPPQEICPIGYAAVSCGGRCDNFYVCEQIGFAPADLVCQEGYHPVIGTELCAKKVPAIGTCPYGSEEINGQCTITVRTKPLTTEYAGIIVPYPKKGGYSSKGKVPVAPYSKPYAGGYPVSGGKQMPPVWSKAPTSPNLKLKAPKTSWGGKWTWW